MRHIKIKILTILLLSTIWSFGQLTQAYKNGFIAATSNGVYYLQDGDNQWLNLGGINKNIVQEGSTPTNHDIDTITGVSGEYATGFSNGIIVSEAVQEYHGVYKYYGYKSTSKDINRNSTMVSYEKQCNKNLLTLGSINKTTVAYYLKKPNLSSGSHFSIGTDNYSDWRNNLTDLDNITSFSTDNDSIVVWSGKNNKLYKMVVSSIANNRTHQSISGLASSVSSAHQITYNPTDDLFYIVSDEGFIYTYDKSTVTKIKEITSYCDGGCDSVTDVSYSPQDSILYIGVVNGAGEKQATLLYLNSANYGTVNQINYTSTADIQMTVNSAGKVLFNINNGFYLYGKTSAKTLPSLPSGVTVYDLDYIDYLPYIDTGATPPPTNTITYEGTLTVGEIGDLGYGYLFLRDLSVSGEVNPLFDGDYFGITIAYVLENTSLTVGSIDNSNASVPPFSTTTEIISFEINAVSYALTKTNLGEGHYEWLYFTETNPFPAIGETCTIKIIYTP